MSAFDPKRTSSRVFTVIHSTAFMNGASSLAYGDPIISVRESAFMIVVRLQRGCRRPRKFSDIAILRKGIEWISSINKAGTADGEKSFYFTDCFGHHAVWLAGLKFVLQLNKGLVSRIESVCQRCSNIKDRDRILREKGGRVGYMKLRGFQGTHLRRVRLAQQDGEFAKNGTRLRHPSNLCILLYDCDCALREDEQPTGPRTLGNHRFAGLVGHDRKRGN